MIFCFFFVDFIFNNTHVHGVMTHNFQDEIIQSCLTTKADTLPACWTYMYVFLLVHQAHVNMCSFTDHGDYMTL